jgi:biotin carboxylase
MTTVVIVDAYATTKRLGPAFRAAGCDVLRVLSTPEPPPLYRPAFDTSSFTATLRHDDDFGATLDAVAAYRPDAVLAAGESGVELADRLAEALGLPGNGTALSAARRDKFAQIEAVRAAGLRAAAQIRVRDARHLADWHRSRGGRVVVKPVRSAGGDGVSFCDSPDQSVAA